MENKGENIIYETKDGKTSIDVKMEDETINHRTINQYEKHGEILSDSLEIVNLISKNS